MKNTPLFFVTKNTTHDLEIVCKKTQEMYQKALSVGLGTEEGDELIKNTITNGLGGYAALAAKPWCERLLQRTIRLGMDLNEVIKTDEKYLKLAKEKNLLIGSFVSASVYLAIFKYVQLGARFATNQQNPILDGAFVKNILTNYFVSEKLAEVDTVAYQLLTEEIMKDLNAPKEQLKATVSSNQLDKKSQVELLNIYNTLLKIHTPLDLLKSQLEAAKILTNTTLVEEARQATMEALSKNEIVVRNKG